MKIRKSKSWQLETTGIDGNTKLFGVNIFDYQLTYAPQGRTRTKKQDIYYRQNCACGDIAAL